MLRHAYGHALVNKSHDTRNDPRVAWSSLDHEHASPIAAATSIANKIVRIVMSPPIVTFVAYVRSPSFARHVRFADAPRLESHFVIGGRHRYKE